MEDDVVASTSNPIYIYIHIPIPEPNPNHDLGFPAILLRMWVEGDDDYEGEV